MLLRPGRAFEEIGAQDSGSTNAAPSGLLTTKSLKSEWISGFFVFDEFLSGISSRRVDQGVIKWHAPL
jgi:hypothetical protein